MSSLPTIMEEWSEDQVLTKLCDYRNVTFYKTIIPHDPYPEDFLMNLKSKNVGFLVRTNRNHYNSKTTIIEGISEILLNYSTPIPEGFVLDLFIQTLRDFVSEKDPVSVSVEGSENGAFILAYTLIQLGMNWKKALGEVNKAGLQLASHQMDFLRWKSTELKNHGKKCCSLF